MAKRSAVFYSDDAILTEVGLTLGTEGNAVVIRVIYTGYKREFADYSIEEKYPHLRQKL